MRLVKLVGGIMARVCKCEYKSPMGSERMVGGTSVVCCVVID